MNVYTHIGLDDAQAEVEKKNDAKAVSQKMFKVV